IQPIEASQLGGVSAHADRAGDLRPSLQQLASRHGICAATFALIRHRELVSVDTGQGCGAERALSADAVFQAASLSKPVFAYAVLTLVRQGRLRLDDPISMHLPDGAVHRAAPHRPTGWTDHVPAWRLSGITVRMALNHTSGLPNWATPALNGLRVDGALADGTALAPLQFEQALSAFSLQTTARDYGAFVAALLKDDSMLQQIVERPVPMAPGLGVRWGLGWGLAQGPAGDLLWHWGNNPGYRSFVMASPASGDALVLFAAQDGGLVLARPLAEAVFPGLHPLFRLPLLRDGLDSLLCEIVDLCG
ncbi:serine hydrolase domain-containing protein, partial [Aquincola tertiaricarbonis]|uniref:serine hydrolase domain-containing protein n=1 Tax=Aquincola tertiaricarbonis TaxID=391953 RepID=UPI000AB55E0A